MKNSNDNDGDNLIFQDWYYDSKESSVRDDIGITEDPTEEEEVRPHIV